MGYPSYECRTQSICCCFKEGLTVKSFCWLCENVGDLLSQNIVVQRTVWKAQEPDSYSFSTQKNVWPWDQESYLLNIVTGCCVISSVKHRKTLVNFQRITEHGCYFSGIWKTTDNASKVAKVFKEKKFLFHTLICLPNIEQSKDEVLDWKEKHFAVKEADTHSLSHYGLFHWKSTGGMGGL